MKKRYLFFTFYFSSCYFVLHEWGNLPYYINNINVLILFAKIQSHPEENSQTINQQQSLVENIIKQKNIESNIHNQNIIYYLESLPETQQSISDNVSVTTTELNGENRTFLY